MIASRHLGLRSPSVFALEPIESRRHFSVSSWSSDSISSLTDSYFAQVDMGSDGDPNGFATSSAGIGDIQSVWSFTTWDTNLDNGLDSTWRTVTFALNNKNNGMESFKVDTGSVQSFYAGPSIAVNSVTFRAAVQGANMEMDWRSISVKFYSGTTLVETDPLSDFGASTMSSGTVQESGVVLTPTASNVTGVTVSAQVRLQAAAGTYAGSSDIFGQILIN